MGSDRFLTTREVADMLGKTRTTVTAWCRDGKLNARKFEGDWYIIKKDFIERMRETFSDCAEKEED